MEKTTESASSYNCLEKMDIEELLQSINNEDKTVPYAVEKCIPQIKLLVEAATNKMKNGGRLFYIGAGTSGRLAIVDASECPPTFGVDFDKVIGLIAGGDSAIRKAVEFAEDDVSKAWEELLTYNISDKDVLIGIAASGQTPYVLAGLQQANKKGILTGCIVCNKGSIIAKNCTFPIEVVVGPEFITGSTRMKSGTAQKLVLNMISTSVMVQLGYVKGNKMINMQLTNNKLIDRGIRMLMEETGLLENEAAELLIRHGNVRKATEIYKKSIL